MNALLFRISLAGMLAIASLLVVLYRVSPIESKVTALSFFALTLFLTLATTGSLLLYCIWRLIPLEGMDRGKKLSVSIREGIFFSIASLLIVFFHILAVLNWWIAALIYVVFFLIEAALHM